MSIIELEPSWLVPDFSGSLDLPCQQVDPDLFFAELPADVELAKALCRECPLAVECLSGALERGEAAGVWGGELLVGGEIVARKRPRGRPRKNPLPEPIPVLPVELRPVRAA